LRSVSKEIRVERVEVLECEVGRDLGVQTTGKIV
jgi:hypothetical protein